MPKLNELGVKGLRKQHTKKCPHSQKPTKCDCPWYVRYKGVEVHLSKWAASQGARENVDPYSKKVAEEWVRKYKVAVDNAKPKPTWAKAGPNTVAGLIEAYIDHNETKRAYAKDSGHVWMLNLVKGEVGDWRVVEVSPELITDWLKHQMKARDWRPKTWNEYRTLFISLFTFATERGWAQMNPALPVARKQSEAPRKRERLTPDDEQRLLDACDKLDDPARAVTRATLTGEKVAEIRRRAASGVMQVTIARDMQISQATVSQIVKGQTWADRPARTTYGPEMKRRLRLAFRTGARAGEMVQVKLEHLDFRPDAVIIVLPPEITKGGKTREQPEVEPLPVTDAELIQELKDRRQALRRNPPSAQYVFGREEGTFVAKFRKSWNAVFDIAGIPRGRYDGSTWHTIRHEAISRVADTTDNAFDVQAMARHKDIKTSQGYVHKHVDRLVAISKKAQPTMPPPRNPSLAPRLVRPTTA